jgi:hypothetical protein
VLPRQSDDGQLLQHAFVISPLSACTPCGWQHAAALVKRIAEERTPALRATSPIVMGFIIDVP